MKTNFTTILLIAALIFSFNLNGQNQLNGVINYHNNPNKPIEDVNVQLFDDANNFIAATTTNSDGQYSFVNLPNGSYTIVPSANFEIAGDGMSDAFLVLMHIIGFNTLTGLEFSAGDVNEDNVINMADYISILVGWLTGGNPPPGDAWEFESFTVSLAKDSVFSSGGTSDVDVDGSWAPGVKPEACVKPFYTETIERDINSEIEIPMQIESNIPVAGLNLVLEFPSEFISITSVSSPLGDINYNVQGDILRITWMDVKSKNNFDPQITVTAVTSPYFVGEQQVSLKVLDKSHMIDPKGHLIENVEIEMPELTTLNKTFALGEIYPNPASDLLNIDYKLEEAGLLTMEIYGMNGQHMATRTINNQFPGMYKETFDVKALGLAPGIYSLRISTNGNATVITKKLLVTK